jgi:hypothetical protein
MTCADTSPNATSNGLAVHARAMPECTKFYISRVYPSGATILSPLRNGISLGRAAIAARVAFAALK